MKFKSTQELLDFMNKLDLDESTLVFKKDVVQEEQAACSCQTKVEETVTVELPSSLIVESFSDNPSFPVERGTENKFYVKDYKAIPDLCGTGQIALGDRIVSMNMCESEGQAKIVLSVNDGNSKRDAEFILERTTGDCKIVLAE